VVVENNVRYAFGLVMSGDGNGGDAGAAGERCVDGDEAVDGALQQHLLAALDHFRLMMMADEEVDVVGFVQALLDATEDEGGVTFADLWCHHADGHALLLAQGPREEVWAIVHGRGSGEDALLSDIGNGFGGGRSAKDARDGGDGEAKVLCEALEADGGGLAGERVR
jgi:hypothetical protein